MATFDIKARNLLNKVGELPTTGDQDKDNLSRANKLAKLAQAGFGVDEIFHELRSLYDNTDDDSIKRQVLDLVIKVQGLALTEKEQRETPQIVFNFINVDRSKLDGMLCPTVIS